MRFLYEDHKHNILKSSQKVDEAVSFLLNNICIRFGTKLYKQIIGIPLGTYFTSFIVVLFMFCNERYFLLSISHKNHASIIEEFTSTSRYLDDLLNIDHDYFEKKKWLHDLSNSTSLKTNTADTEAPFMD